MNKRKFVLSDRFWALVISLVIVSGFILDKTEADSDKGNFYSDILRLENVVTKVHQGYVEEINSEDLVDNAIEGMIGILDPHTTYFKKKDYEELKIHTEGKFGGLGIQISIREKVLTVMTPISGTPASRAGIRSGDQIIKIEGESTKGITINQAVAKLRGEPNTDVNITIRRKGVSELLEYKITRGIIKIKSVPYAGLLDGTKVGYLKLVTFSEDAGEEVGKALDSLLKAGAESIVFDLRFNPGGLLKQAVDVANKFLPRGSLVVSTRGRSATQNRDVNATSSPVIPADMPVAVLVNGASASAAEIVSGAIQDWDRGVIVGDTTYGKGSVQTVVPIDQDHHIKLTTAFYYTPSGRCINKHINGIRIKEKRRRAVIDSLKRIGLDSLAERVDSTKTFKTKSGRIVYDAGGIIPDTTVFQDTINPIVGALFIKDMFFKFANTEYPKLFSDKKPIQTGFTVDDKIMNDFKKFLKTSDFKFDSYYDKKFKEFSKMIGIYSDTSDTSFGGADSYYKPDFTDSEKSSLVEMRKKIETILRNEYLREFDNNIDLIAKYVQEAMLVRGLGQDNPFVYGLKLKGDRQVEVAAKIVLDSSLYSKFLKTGK